MELEDPKDLRARIRKFLILTNERKKMSIKTLRKHIAVTATTALLVGVLSAMNTSVANANTHPNAGTANLTTYSGLTVTSATQPGSMMVATGSNSTTSATVSTALDTETTTMGATCDLGDDGALSKGLLQKDSSSGIAQTATVLAGGVLSLYSCTATAVAFKASGGSFVAYGLGNTGWSYSSSNSTVWSPNNTVATSVAALWTAPSTVGTYTVSLYAGYYTTSTGTQVIASSSSPAATPPILAANITVSVVASSTGGSYAATESYCQAVRGTTASVSSNVDTAGPAANGESWSIDFALNDASGKNLSSSTALVATATNGALLAFGTAGTTPVAGTTSTIVTSSEGDDDTIRVSQPTAGAPLTTTVTLSANGTVVCTKTVSIAGTVAALTIPAANIAVQDLSQTTGSNAWFAGDTRVGTFYVVATDSVGNRLATPSTLGTFGVDSGTGTTVTDVTFGSSDLATSTSSSSPLSATVGNHVCAATAGTQKGVIIKFTLANGKVITSAPIDLSCANDAATYTASFDKAKYVSGDVAKLTVSFKDSKGFAANNVDALGGHTVVVPGMTLVSASGAATAVPKAGSKLEYTFTVGQTAGKYAAVVDFTGGTTELATYATVQNPSYEITSGGDTTSNADVLKSIVALIASINKQIQALQKLILKR
jgi:hypothetical protein